MVETSEGRKIQQFSPFAYVKKSSKPAIPAKPRSSGIKWYDDDNTVICDAMKHALLLGVRLNMAQVVILLIRTADLKKLTVEDYQKAAIADDGRRKQKLK